MNIQPFDIEGVFLINNFVAEDKRGVFVKTFHEENFKESGLQTAFRESYYSMSVRDVIRGMHFQIPPYDHEKLVYVTEGEILDIVVDLRKDSTTFKSFISVNLKAFSNSIYIPKGCAHGFLTISDSASVVYNVSTVYNPTHDNGIKWDSFGFEWPVINPIISDRDSSFQAFKYFNSPF